MKENQTIDAINYQTIYKLFISVFLIIIFYFKLTNANIKISVNAAKNNMIQYNSNL